MLDSLTVIICHLLKVKKIKVKTAATAKWIMDIKCFFSFCAFKHQVSFILVPIINTEQIIAFQKNRRLDKTLLVTFYCHNTFTTQKKRLSFGTADFNGRLTFRLIGDQTHQFHQHLNTFSTSSFKKKPIGLAVAVESRYKLLCLTQYQRNKEKMSPLRKWFSATCLALSVVLRPQHPHH